MKLHGNAYSEEQFLAAFWRRFEPQGDCRVWTGAPDSRGYGLVRRHGRLCKVHRVVWELERGPIPNGLDVLHTCDNPPCARIEHLFLGTNDDNMADKVSKGRQSRLRGERMPAPHRKVSERQAAEIRGFLEVYGGRFGLTTRIAEHYGVPRSTITNIRAGTAWAWLEPVKPDGLPDWAIIKKRPTNA